MSASPLNLYDVDEYSASKKGQVVSEYAGDEEKLEYRFDVTDAPAASTTDTAVLTIPSGSVIKGCDVLIEETLSGGVNFTVGLQQADGTEIDNDGLVAASAATTGYVQGAGALIDTQTAADGQVVVTTDRTAGVMKVVVTYLKA